MVFRNYSFGRFAAIGLFAVVMAMFAVPASAQTLYSNGPIDGTVGGWTIGPASGGYSVADSFTLSGASTLTGVADIGLWTDPGDTPATVDWSIGTSPFDTSDGSGTGSLSGSALSPSSAYGIGGYYSVYSEDFTLPSISLGGGTYYLTLSNASVGNGDFVFWDENNGPSTAYDNTIGSLYNCDEVSDTSCSESFQILGTTSAPEPGTLALLGIGLLCLVPLSLRRRGTSVSSAA
jgi:hypothetical protein